MFSHWIVTNITSASVTIFLAFLAGIISWSVYCILGSMCKIHLGPAVETPTSLLQLQVSCRPTTLLTSNLHRFLPTALKVQC
jgi:uncharacterized protein with PQ loop repeat